MSNNMSKIFLSSIFEASFHIGFKKERDKLGEFLNLHHEFKVINLDNGMADLGDTTQNSLEAIEKSDFVILFLGTTYGSIRNDIPSKYQYLLQDDETLSLTHLEYRYARNQNIPVIVFVFPRADSYQFPKDKEKGTIEHVNKFLAEVNSNGTSSYIVKYTNSYNSIIEYKKAGKYCLDTEKTLPIDMYTEYLAAKMSYNISVVLYQNKLKKIIPIEVSLEEECKEWRIQDNIDDAPNHFVIVSDISEDNLKSVKQIRNEIINAGALDQKYLYYSAESVSGWKDWESGEDKSNTSKQEEEAFLKLIESNSWKDKIDNVDTVVDLGVGVGDKCVLLLNAVKDKFVDRPLNLIVVDSSHYMIEVALKNISDKSESFSLKYTIDGFKADFMKLENSKKRLQGATNFQNVFMLLGGTLGNLDERVFMESLKEVIKKGDFFIIGAFLTSGTEEDLSKIEKDYDNGKVKHMFGPSLRELGLDLSKVKSGWEEEDEIIINGSKRLGFTGKVSYPSGEIIREKWIELFYTTRYNHEELVRYIERYKFKKINSYFNNDESFVYLTFEFKGE